MTQQMSTGLVTELSLGQVILERLNGIDSTLRRICWEKDLMLAAILALLKERGLHESANQLTEAIEQLYQERAEAAAEARERQERDTEPPGAP